jgi:hypothetical protein
LRDQLRDELPELYFDLPIREPPKQPLPGFSEKINLHH